MNHANEEALQKLVDEYQAQQPKVKVKLVNQIGYREAFEKYKAGLRTGDLPDLVQIEDTGTQQMIDTSSIVPMSACMKADKYDTSDFIPRTLTVLQRSTRSCGRCRSTSRTRSSTTTGTRSPRRASTRTSRRRRSSR